MALSSLALPRPACVPRGIDGVSDFRWVERRSARAELKDSNVSGVSNVPPNVESDRESTTDASALYKKEL
jgi:hypothetical protein